MEENNFVPPSDAVVTKSKKSNFVPPTDAILKKKVDSKPRSQEELWGSESQPQDLYTSLATGAQEPQQESDGLGGPPKMKTFTGLTPEEQQTLQAKPAIKVSKSVDLTSKRLKLQNELSKTNVTPENQAEISRKTDELSSIVKEQDKIGKTRLSELEQQFKSSKDENSANAEAEERLNNLITNTGVWNNVKSKSIDVYNSVVDELSALTDEVGIKELKADTDPLSEEKNKVIKDALKKKIRLDENQINEEAKKLYKDKQVESIETDRINSFLDNLDDEDKNLLKQDRYNRSVHLQEDNVKQEKIINAYEVVGNKKIKEYQDIENELLNFKSQNKEVPKELYDSYINLGFEIKGISNSISKRQKLLQKNKEDLGDVNQEFDFFKRQYGDVENFLLNTGTMARKLAVNTLGGLNYVGSLGGIIGDKNLGVQKDVIRINAEIDDQRDRLRKSVESIESPEGFVNYVSDIMSNQIPSLVVTSTGAGGLAAIGVSTAGEKYADMNKEVLEGKATYSPLQMASVPFLYGAAEVVSEIPTLSILKKGGRLLESITKNEADLITKSVKQKAKEWAKDWSVDTGKEIAGEEFTNFAQNFTDKYVLGKKDVGLLDNAGTVLKDTFTLTSILKAAPHVAGAILKPHQTNEDLLILDDNSRKIIEFSNQIDSNVLSDKEKAVVTKQMNKLVAKNSEIIANTIDKVDNMPVDVYKKVIELNDKAANIKSEAVTINDGVLPNKNDLLKELSVEYKSVRDQRNALLSIKYQAPEVVEEVKPAEEPTIKDSQIPLKRETFEFESAEGDILDVQVTTRKDGSRDFVAKDKDGRIVSSQKVGKDNTLTTEEYVTKGYGDIQGESKLEQGNDIMAPAMKDKLTPEQKKELGITEEPAVEEVIPTEEVKVENNGIEYTKNEDGNWVNNKTGNEVKGIGETGKELIKTLDELSIPKTQAEQYSEDLDKTKESDPEAYWSVSPVSAADAAKGTIIDTPDGAAIVKPDGDIAGLFKKATSKAKGVAQDLLKRAIAAGGKKLDNYDTYLTPQYIKAGFRVVSRTPFNEEYAPPGWNKELHGTPDVVAMVYDPENKLDIEEKTFDDPSTGYDDAIAYRDSILEIDAELEGLAKLFDESEKGFRESQVDKAKEALKGILPGVKFIVHETNEAYKNATGESGSGGMYIYSAGGDKVIHINKQKANGRTVAHEVFHAVILDKIKGDKAVQEITARMVDAVYKTASPELRAELDAFAARYSDKTIRDEERLAELIGIIADGYPKMSPANKSIVKRWLDALAKTFGLKPFTDNEVIDLLNTLAGKISTGEVISAEDVSILGYGSVKIKKDIKRESKFIDSLVFNRFPTNKNTKVLENFDLSTIDGQVAASTLSDKLTAGELKKYKLVDGKKVLESVYTFFGGIGYPEVTGYVWAASTEGGVKKIIDDMKVSSDGYKYLIPAVMSNVSHMSNKNMTSITMEVFKEAINNKEINRNKFKEVILKAFDNKDTERFKEGAVSAISGNISAINMADNLRDYILSSKMTFESRKKLLESMVGNPESGNPKFSTVGTFLSLAKSLTEPIAKDADLYQVPVIIRTKGNLTPVKTEEKDKFYHESYGYHIESDQEIEVLHLDGVYNLTDIIPEFTKEDGTTVSTAKELKDKGAKGWDIKRILTNLGRTHGLSKYSAKIVSKKPQVEEDKAIKRSQLTDEGVTINAKSNTSFTVTDNGNVVGSMQLTSDKALGKGYLSVDLSKLNEKYIGKGIGLDLYRTVANKLKDKGIVLTSSMFRNEKSDRVWKSLEKSGEAVEIYSDPKLKKTVYALVNPEVRRSQKVEWEESKIGKGDKAITERQPVLQNAAERYANKEISYEEYLKIKDVTSPIKPITDFIEPAKEEDIKIAVGKNSEGKTNLEFLKGMLLGLRLDIPAYINKNIWAITIHAPGKGKVLSYNNVARIKNVTFGSNAKDALNIARKKISKATIARMEGEWIPIEGNTSEEKGKNAMKFVESIMNNPEWSQVGMNPFRHSWFYDRADGKPVLAADELIQIGGLVYAKNVVKTTPYDKAFEFLDKEGDVMRFQQAKSIDEIVRIAKEAKYSDAAISAFLKAKGFSAEEYTNAILGYNKKNIEARQKEEGIFTREGRNKVISSLSSFKRKFLSARSFLGKTTFIAKEGIEAGIKAQSKIASYLVSDLDNAIKKYDGDKEKIISDFDKFIRGESVSLPDNFLEIGNAMRVHIDKLSYELINSGAVDEYQAENIKKNIGTYLTRSYEVFDKKDWAKMVDEETLQAARNFLKKQLLSEATKEAKASGLDVDLILEKKVDQAVTDLINREGAQSFVASGKTGSKDVSILKQKTDIPLEIRALMGEYTDPAQNYSRTIFKVASLINNAKFLNTVRNNGIGVYLFEKNDINRPKEFDTLIAAEGSETMNPLNGLYTTKEIAESLKESAGILNAIEVALPYSISGTVKSTYEYYMKLLGGVKWLKTIASVGTHFKNVSGNVTFMLANGYFKPDAYRQSAKAIYNDFLKNTDQELRDKMQEYIEAGIIDQSAVLGELRSMFKEEDFDKTFERRMNSEKLNSTNRFIDRVKRLGKKGAELAQNAYQAEDDYFKIVSYETEKNRYAKAMFRNDYSKLSENEQSDVRDHVREITKNVLPNYGRVPGAVKLVKAFPVVGTFISFQTEALRTAYNIVNLSVTELKSSNPEIKKIGALRMSGIIASQAIKYGVMYLIGGSMLGDDDDEKKEKAKRFVAPWSKNSNVLITKEGDGKFSYIDFSASDPFGGIVKPINAAMRGEDLLDGFIQGTKELVSPFTNPDILKSMFTEISENKDSYGNQLYNPSDTFEVKSSAILSRVYKTFEPGTLTSVRKISKSDSPLNEMTGQFTGYKANDVDLAKQFSFKISDMKKMEVETRNIYNRAFRKFENKEITEAELQAAYNQSNKATIDTYKELKKDYDSAIFFGTDYKDLKDEMKRSKVSKDVIRGITTGDFKDLKKKEGIETDAQLKARNPRIFAKIMAFRARRKKAQ